MPELFRRAKPECPPGWCKVVVTALCPEAKGAKRGSAEGHAERGKKEEGRGHLIAGPLQSKVWPGGARQVALPHLREGCVWDVEGDRACRNLCLSVHSHA